MIKKKYQYITLVVFGLTLLLAAVLYISAIYSEPYKVAEHFLRDNTLIKENLGQVYEVRLSPLGYALNYGGTSGNAEFKIVVMGKKAGGVVFIKLLKEVGKWGVVIARLKYGDGEFMDVMPAM